MAASEGAGRVLRGSVTAWWVLLLSLLVVVLVFALTSGVSIGDSWFLLFGIGVLWVAMVWGWVVRPLVKLAREQRVRACVLRQDLVHSERFKSELLGSLSHALRTPASTILASCEQLKEATLEESERAEIQSSLVSSAERIVQVSEDLIEATFAQNNEIPIAKEELDVEKFFAPLLASYRARAEEKGLEFRVPTRRSGLPQTIKADPRRVRQILNHLVDNAIRCTEVGWIEVELSVDQRHGIRDLMVSLKDSGAGVSAEERVELFKPFSHGERGLSRRHSGLGLGLYLARSMARRMGGDVLLVESRVGRGSHFSVWLGAEVVSGSVRGADAVCETIDFAEKRILVVDDCIENALLVRKQLESVGAEVVAAHSGKEALDMVAHSDYHLILLDLQMPEMDGFQVLRKLRSLRVSTPVVALTAHGMDSEVQRTRRSGFDGHLVKPLRRSALFEAIRQITERRAPLPAEASAHLLTSVNFTV